MLVSISPLGKTLEEQFGLAFLFTLRGSRKVPEEVAVCAIEDKSASYFHVKQQPYKWPRTIHAEALDRLADLGAVTVGFDLFFEETRSERDDRLFARAIKEHGNVVLLQRLTRATGLPNATTTSNGRTAKLIMEQVLPLAPMLADNAAGLAPFPLPQTPVRLDQAWLFKTGSGEMATLPTLMFVLFRPGIWQQFEQLLQQVDPGISADRAAADDRTHIRMDARIQQLRSHFQNDPVLTAKMKAAVEAMASGGGQPTGKASLASLVNLMAGSSTVIINYYGPPGTVNTIPYYRLWETDQYPRQPDMRGKAVFIGLNHEAELGEKDGFFTLFTNAEGRHVSGVEVAATIFANLVDGSSIHPVSSFTALVLLIGIAVAVGFVSLSLNPVSAGLTVIGICLGYLAAACSLFSARYCWTPLIVPLLIQAPCTYLAVIISTQMQLRRKKRNIIRALQCYIPERIALELERDFSQIGRKRDEIQGICLFSDLENYTVLSETIGNEELSRRINRYYEEMFQIVKRCGGTILDIRGDSMLALWPDDANESGQANNSCRAALAISALFNDPKAPSHLQLPTRCGLHQGLISLGNIGALDHFQYTVTGDTVNTASRIESFNKQLRTKLLVSAAVAEKADAFACRKLGTFCFVGKQQPLTLYELLGSKENITTRQTEISRCFEEALTYFMQGAWQQAATRFARCNELAPEYGPARWFQQLCRKYHQLQQPEGKWDGVIRLEQK